jgi:hypothetical protein
MAGAISKTGDIDGFPDVSVVPNTEGKAVIHFDTEQSEIDHQHNFKSILKRAGFDTTPDYFHSYNILSEESEEYKEITTAIATCVMKVWRDHLIVVDGIADYIDDVNEPKGAKQIVAYFRNLASSTTALLS